MVIFKAIELDGIERNDEGPHNVHRVVVDTEVF